MDRNNALINLLLIEDDNDIRTFYEKYLSGHGYTVTTATDGEDGWAKLKADPSKYKVILLDVMMPKLDGVGFLKRKIEDQDVKSVPVVMVTNVGNDETMQECFKYGAKYFILKVEIDPTKIPEILQKAMSSS